jgi:hypothetical protein
MRPTRALRRMMPASPTSSMSRPTMSQREPSLRYVHVVYMHGSARPCHSTVSTELTRTMTMTDLSRLRQRRPSSPHRPDDARNQFVYHRQRLGVNLAGLVDRQRLLHVCVLPLRLAILRPAVTIDTHAEPRRSGSCCTVGCPTYGRAR